MNILKNYTLRINGFSLSDMTKILNGNHNRYSIERKGYNMYVISDANSPTPKFTNLKCISDTYTTNEDRKKLKLANINGKCFNCKKAFDMISSDDCLECNKRALSLFKENKIHAIKK